jgi:methylated-DNA-[protein]-cysteine S-methyltransferase
MAERLLFDTLKTPIGKAVIACGEDRRLRLLDWRDNETRWRGMLAKLYGGPEYIGARDPFGLTSALESYFAGELAAIDKLPVAYDGTAFRNTVWKALRKISAGKTLSYGELAAKIGSPLAARAVGAACGANPVSIVVPCHRAIGMGGALTGYAGGLSRKRWLLDHEGAKVGE